MPELGVVIPAREGAATLGSVLEALARQNTTRRMHIVVVTNGPRDGTARVAADHARRLCAAGHDCSVAVSRPGRAYAIRLGERLLPPGDRVVLDCDAVVSDNAMEELAVALGPGTGIHFAAPRLVLTRSRSLATRCFFRTWQALPYVRESPVTCGIYAVSADGRRRWSELPAIHSDDKLARLFFCAQERQVVATATYTVDPPHGFRALVAARKRYIAGNRELRTAFPQLAATDVHRYGGIVTTLLRRPRLWPSSLVFTAVYLAAIVQDRWSCYWHPIEPTASTSFTSPNAPSGDTRRRRRRRVSRRSAGDMKSQ